MESSSSSQFENRTIVCSFFIGHNENCGVLLHISSLVFFLLSVMSHVLASFFRALFADERQHLLSDMGVQLMKCP